MAQQIESVRAVADATFDAEVLGRGRVRSWSTSGRAGAPPCRMVAPIVEEIAAENRPVELAVAKIDTDANPRPPTASRS